MSTEEIDWSAKITINNQAVPGWGERSYYSGQVDEKGRPNGWGRMEQVGYWDDYLIEGQWIEGLVMGQVRTIWGDGRVASSQNGFI